MSTTPATIKPALAQHRINGWEKKSEKKSPAMTIDKTKTRLLLRGDHHVNNDLQTSFSIDLQGRQQPTIH